MRVIPSATGALHRPPLLLKQRNQKIPLVALDFDHTIFYCATGAAFGFQHLGIGFQFFVVQWNAGNQGDTLTLAALGLPAYSDNAIPGRP